MSDYQSFLDSKHVRHDECGIAVDPDSLNPLAKDWQRAVVAWWLRLGRAAGFQDCGLGKTLQQLMFCEELIRRGHALRALILAPPAVGQQTMKEAEKFGIGVEVRQVKDQSEVGSGINISNYERLHKFDPAAFDIIDCDESGILKSYMGKTKQALLSAFKDTKYRLACTATPAPNDTKELGNHAEFLGIMRSSEMLARWFINDLSAAGEYRLKGYAAADFWRWMASWAVSVGKPSDLGDFSDDGYELPPLEIIEHIVGQVADQEFSLSDQPASGKLSATGIHATKRQTAEQRAGRAGELVAAEFDEPWVLWCDTNYDADAIRSAVPSAIEIRGSEKLEAKEEKLAAFLIGQIKHLVTKAEIAGFGLNWQHCARTAVVSPNWSYEGFYQLIRRFYRFGQERPVKAYVIATPAESELLDAIKRKGDQHDTMKNEMASAMRTFQSDNLSGGKRSLSLAPTPTSTIGNNWQLWHGDCVEVAKLLPDNAIDFTIHSPPFSNLYIYSDSAADMGNSANDDEFFTHYGFLIKELYRVTTPGRLCAVHCKDLPRYKGRDGFAGLNDFPGEIVRAFSNHGWAFHSRVTIWKCPVTEMQRTKNHGLLHRQLCKDSAASRQGMADFLLVFRKWEGEEFPKPVTSGDPYCRFTRYVGENPPDKTYAEYEDERRQNAAAMFEATGDWQEPGGAHPYSIQVWQRYASPVWFDICQTRTLNYRLAKEGQDEKHICPLQLDVIERAIELWTNPGDIVYDPFNGIGSSGHVALGAGRKYVASELKKSYYDISVENLTLASPDVRQLALPLSDEREPIPAFAVAT